MLAIHQINYSVCPSLTNTLMPTYCRYLLPPKVFLKEENLTLCLIDKPPHLCIDTPVVCEPWHFPEEQGETTSKNSLNGYSDSRRRCSCRASAISNSDSRTKADPRPQCSHYFKWIILQFPGKQKLHLLRSGSGESTQGSQGLLIEASLLPGRLHFYPEASGWSLWRAHM